MEDRIPLQLPFEFNRDNIKQFGLWLDGFSHNQKIDWFFKILSNGEKYEQLHKDIDKWAIIELDFWENELIEEGIMREAKKLINFVEATILIPTEKGRKIKACGGWLPYLEAQREDEKRQQDLINSSLLLNIDVKATNKVQKISIITTMVVFAASVCFQIMTYYRDADNSKQIEVLKLQQKQVQTQLNKIIELQRNQPPKILWLPCPLDREKTTPKKNDH